ncbi:alpha/beta fold hydrolase [Nocardia brasiliensis]|uniref:alpha/beta fold hydrolase n=1 Tax=Nocardia brasiliensis TaxID=37326 RepID=UPI001894FEA9|nr:alpha/beta hydrolase [Nocardia brasiliensis]MBF6129867.1 alpha/beta hydrolase [Nocardia brasiliensis]
MNAQATQDIPERDRPRRRWIRRILVGFGATTALSLVLVLAAAYVWQPVTDPYVSKYLTRIESRYAQTAVANFHYTRTGQGSPVVLVPGGGQWLYSYRDVVPVLAERHTVFAVDLPGQGYTTLNQRDFTYDLDAMAAALGEFMDAVGLSKSSIVGHSWGGAISLYFAERQPHRVDRLGLLAAPGLDVPSSWDWRPLEVPVVGELMTKLMTKQNSAATQRKSFANPERVTPELIDENWAPLSKPSNRTALWAQQRRFDYSLTERLLGQVQAPTLVVWGGADQFDEPWQAAELARRIPDARSQVFEGCGHSVHEDCTDRVVPLLDSFLAN